LIIDGGGGQFSSFSQCAIKLLRLFNCSKLFVDSFEETREEASFGCRQNRQTVFDEAYICAVASPALIKYLNSICLVKQKKE
jgi:hypothetical protein